MYYIVFLLPLFIGSSALTAMLQYLSADVQRNGLYVERLIYNVLHALLGVVSVATLYSIYLVLSCGTR